MARWRRISKVFVRYWVANYWTWENGFRGSFTRRNKSWQNSKVETLDPQIESRRCSTTIKSTTWFCSSGKRMQEIFHEFLARTREENRTTPRSQQWRQRKAQVFEGIEEYDFFSRSSNRLEVEKAVAGRPVAFVLVNKLGTQQLDDEKVEFFAFFTVGRLPNFPTIDGRCEQNTHSHSMYRCAQCVSHIHCTVWSHFITRTRVSLERTAQDCTHWCLQNSLSSTRHVSFLAAPDTDHQHKFSLTCLIYLPAFSPLQSCPFVLDPHVPCDDSRRSGGSTEIPSPTQSAVSVKRVYISKVIYNTETSCCSECTAGGTVSTVGVVSWVTQHHPREVALVPYPFSAQSFSFQGHFELSRLCCRFKLWAQSDPRNELSDPYQTQEKLWEINSKSHHWRYGRILEKVGVEMP